ncbi:MAG: hypothetical protein V3R26_04600, partial [Hyphomicrobium sp.]
MSDKPKIRGLSQILTFFRKNTTPIYHINYFDSFDGFHPRVFVPREAGVRDFESMEEVCNYLLSHNKMVQTFNAFHTAQETG